VHWAAIVFWSSAILSILLGVIGLIALRWRLVIAGAVIWLPFPFYLLLTPRFRLLAIGAVLSYVGAVAAASQRRWAVAWAMFVPMVVLVWYVAANIGRAQFC